MSQGFGSNLRLALAVFAVVMLDVAPAGAQPANDGCAAPMVIASLPFSHLVSTTTATKKRTVC
jgi:hypothetical protein